MPTRGFVKGDRNGMGCFVRGGRNGMEHFVCGDKKSMRCLVQGLQVFVGYFVNGCQKMAWDVLSWDSSVAVCAKPCEVQGIVFSALFDRHCDTPRIGNVNPHHRNVNSL